MIEAEITQAGLRLQNALVPPTPQGLHNVLGSGYREIQIPLHGGGLRRIRAFDDLGIAYFLDDTPPEVPSILFVLFPQDAPFDVARPFAGRLFINGTAITPEMTGSELPVAPGEHFNTFLLRLLAGSNEKVERFVVSPCCYTSFRLVPPFHT
jgi:hypothetical protein